MPFARPLSRRHLALAGFASLGSALLGGLAGCASLLGPQVISLGQADLDRLLARKFPMTRRVLELLEVTLTAPRIQLLPERNRIAVVLDLASQERLSGLVGRARLGFDSALRYEPRDATLRLTQVRVQQLSLDGSSPTLPGATTAAGPSSTVTPVASVAPVAPGLLARLGQSLAATALDEMVLYSVPAERLADLRRLGLVPGAVTVTVRGVEITLAKAI